MNIEQFMVGLVFFGSALAGLFYFLLKRAVGQAVDRSIETVFARKLEERKDALLRATRTYEHILERRMMLFDRINRRLAELIPLVQDMAQAVESGEMGERQRMCFQRFFELAFEVKQVVLEYEPYVDKCIFGSLKDLVVKMQASFDGWFALFNQLDAGYSVSEDEKNLARSCCEELVMAIAEARALMIEYLKSSAGIEADQQY